MPVFDLFSKRRKRERGEMPDVYVYNEVPNPLRVQLVHIIRDAIGQDARYIKMAQNVYQSVHETICREYGVFTLYEFAHTDEEAVFYCLLNTKDIEQVIDIVEICFDAINTKIREYGYRYNVQCKITPDEAIEELNTRFREHGIGYQFESNEIIRIDSTFIHSDIIKPVLNLLNDKIFAGPNEEFLKAHEHYRHGRNKESLNECLKAFESVMKVICEKRKWSFKKGDTSSKLIEVCLQNGLIPSYMQTQFNSLRSLLESGVPTVRNKLGGHGQGSQTMMVEDYIARYALDLTASNIIFLVNAEREI